ncbi:MAG: RNA ligase family protein [Ignavibacteriaceae bacterium]|jgi:hypothetical protein|nr:RNA ligase family protein [Ignavibacteriaceae bacterium]
MKVKYPRTAHLPFSPGVGEDDIVASKEYHNILPGREVIITEKMDGENTTLYRDYLHARSIQFSPHPSRAWIRRFWAENIQNQIPDEMRICGENLYAHHSIHYKDLSSYFLVFSIWVDDLCLSWRDTEEWCQLLDLHTVPVINQGLYNEDLIKTLAEEIVLRGGEGVVVRPVDKFYMSLFTKSVFKYVRAEHIQTDNHWMTKAVVPNELKKT